MFEELEFNYTDWEFNSIEPELLFSNLYPTNNPLIYSSLVGQDKILISSEIESLISSGSLKNIKNSKLELVVKTAEICQKNPFVLMEFKYKLYESSIIKIQNFWRLNQSTIKKNLERKFDENKNLKNKKKKLKKIFKRK